MGLDHLWETLGSALSPALRQFTAQTEWWWPPIKQCIAIHSLMTQALHVRGLHKERWAGSPEKKGSHHKTLNVSQAWWSGRTWERRRQPHANVFNRPPNSVWHGGHSLWPKGRGRHGTEDCYQTGREASYVDCKEDSVTWRIIKLAFPDNTVCIFILPHPCGFLHFII